MQQPTTRYLGWTVHVRDWTSPQAPVFYGPSSDSGLASHQDEPTDEGVVQAAEINGDQVLHQVLFTNGATWYLKLPHPSVELLQPPPGQAPAA